MSYLEYKWCLILDAGWRPIGFTTIKKGITALLSTADGKTLAADAFNINYPKKNGEYDWTNPDDVSPVAWEKWIELPIRDFDVPIHSPKLVIRAPIVIRARNMTKTIYTQIRPTLKNLYQIYQGIDYWTGNKISYNRASIEHAIPKSHGGKNNWKNLAITEKLLNSERGNTPIEKWKYKPKYKLIEPLPMPRIVTTKHVPRPEWLFFLFKFHD